MLVVGVSLAQLLSGLASSSTMSECPVSAPPIAVMAFSLWHGEGSSYLVGVGFRVGRLGVSTVLGCCMVFARFSVN
jgi:hypothetical protein